MTADLRGVQISARLGELARLLHEQQSLWRAVAFRAPVLAWESEYRALSRALRSLDLADVAVMHADPAAAARFLGQWLPTARWGELAAVPEASLPLPAAWPRDFARDVPGRKWAQIEAFVAAVGPISGRRAVEWCAGKAHLSRAISGQWPDARLVALEKNPELVAQARSLAQQRNCAVAAHCCDVLEEGVSAHLEQPAHLLALHACGELHRRLLRCAVAAQMPAIDLAPCCFHLDRTLPGAALSAAARQHALILDRDAVRGAVQETVTSGAYARAQRERVQQWQLGFDALQRELRGVDKYLAPPGVSAASLSEGFESYCRHAAARWQIELPEQSDFAAWEETGRERFRVVSALDLVRHQFRRALELWLVLDRAHYLLEHGYEVCVSAFCARSITPRNLLIQARRR